MHQFRERLKADGPIHEPGRRHAIFHFALELAHDGLDEDEIMPVDARAQPALRTAAERRADPRPGTGRRHSCS